MVLRCPIVTGMDNDTTPILAAAVPKRPALGKRRFTPQLKARIVKRWVREHHMRGLSKGFVPVEALAPAAPIGDIRIECARGQQRGVVAWPASSAKECAQWLREWLAGNTH